MCQHTEHYLVGRASAHVLLHGAEAHRYYSKKVIDRFSAEGMETIKREAFELRRLGNLWKQLDKDNSGSRVN